MPMKAMLKRRSLEILTKRHPSTSSLMSSGDWDGVLAKMEEKALRLAAEEAAAAVVEEEEDEGGSEEEKDGGEREASAGVGPRRGSGAAADRRGSGAGRRGSGASDRSGGRRGSGRRGSFVVDRRGSSGSDAAEQQRPSVRRGSSSFGRTNFIGQNFLLRTLCEHPTTVPVRVVERMIDLDPDSVLEKDFRGNGALHVAACWGCTLEVVEHLIERNPDMTSEVNNDGWTPLHMAAAPAYASAPDEAEWRPADVMVVATIFLAHPMSIFVVDSDGRTPIGLALESGAPLEVARFLEESAERYKKTMHEVERDLEDRAGRDEVELPEGGLTLQFLAEHVGRSYRWSRGRAVEMFGPAVDREDGAEGGDGGNDGNI